VRGILFLLRLAYVHKKVQWCMDGAWLSGPVEPLPATTFACVNRWCLAGTTCPCFIVAPPRAQQR
jgi:hypothetical protein